MIGAGLGLAGLLFQQVLRNPLAEPSTLGIANGAQLGMTMATLWGCNIISPVRVRSLALFLWGLSSRL